MVVYISDRIGGIGHDVEQDASAAGMVLINAEVTDLDLGPHVLLGDPVQVSQLIPRAQGVVYLDRVPLEPDWASSVPDEIGLRGWEDLPDEMQVKLEAWRTDAGAYIGELAQLDIALVVGGLPHRLTVVTPWFHDLLTRQDALLAEYRDRMQNELDGLQDQDRAHQRTVEAWFRELPDRLDADEDWLRQPNENARKSYLRRLSENELGPAHEGDDARRRVSLIAQAVDAGSARRRDVIARRTNALSSRVDELASLLADDPGFQAGDKKERRRRATARLATSDPLVRDASLVDAVTNRAIELTDRAAVDRSGAPRLL